MITKAQTEARRKLTAALRSGQYRQVRARYDIEDTNQFCVLGLAYYLAYDKTAEARLDYQLMDELQVAYGLTRTQQSWLAQNNDAVAMTQLDFVGLADLLDRMTWIDQHLDDRGEPKRARKHVDAS